MVKSGHKFAFINQNLTATASRGDLSFWQMLNNKLCLILFSDDKIESYYSRLNSPRQLSVKSDFTQREGSVIWLLHGPRLVALWLLVGFEA